jgi:tetratricopeptide (TPR) repeat protein
MWKLGEAIALLETIVERGKAKLAPDHRDTLLAQSELGDSYCHAGRFAEAEPLLAQAYEGFKERAARIPREEPGFLNTTLERLVYLYDAWGKPDEAARWRKELEETKEPAER